MHEFVASAAALKRQTGVRAMDVAKALLDRGIHAPTVYFPLVVEEALMIEPTETESRETVEAIAEALSSIAREAAADPEHVQHAPHNTPVSRPDDALAARQPVLTWEMQRGGGG
jgi:glycine dehydrogenase subunit 2